MVVQSVCIYSVCVQFSVCTVLYVYEHLCVCTVMCIIMHVYGQLCMCVCTAVGVDTIVCGQLCVYSRVHGCTAMPAYTVCVYIVLCVYSRVCV